ncbi:MAG: hypothetical protein IJJ26_03445 [Victivallales bacterium]|nr:hypothetical protein [Victivallales bacterium]
MQQWAESDSANARKQLIRNGTFQGMSQNFVSLAIWILCASFLGVPEYVTACYGAMGYFGYLALPLGYVVCARIGVCKGAFWLRMVANLAFFLVIPAILYPSIGIWLQPLALAMFYFAVSAASATMFPLQKFLTNEKTISGYLGKLSFCRNTCGLLVSLGVMWLLKKYDTNASTLIWLFALAGVSCFLGNTCYLFIKEPQALQADFRQPLYSQLPTLFRNPGFLKLCLAGIFANVLLITLPSASILAAKNGCGATGDVVVILTITQALASIGSSLAYKPLGSRFGPRALLLTSQLLAVTIIAFWTIVPVDAPKFLLVFPFILCGINVVFIGTGFSHYVTVLLSRQLQTAGAFGVLITHGVIAGFLGILLNSLLFKFLWKLPDITPLTHYRQFFLAILVVCAISTWFIFQMPKR